MPKGKKRKERKGHQTKQIINKMLFEHKNLASDAL